MGYGIRPITPIRFYGLCVQEWMELQYKIQYLEDTKLLLLDHSTKIMEEFRNLLRDKNDPKRRVPLKETETHLFVHCLYCQYTRPRRRLQEPAFSKLESRW